MMLPPRVADDRRDGREHPRLVLDLEPQPHEPSGTRERAQDHRRQHAQIDVAAAHDEPDAPAREPLAVLEHRREARRARAFDDELLDLEVEADGLFDRLLAHDDDVVDERVGDLAREPARARRPRCLRRRSCRPASSTVPTARARAIAA